MWPTSYLVDAIDQAGKEAFVEGATQGLDGLAHLGQVASLDD
jgi:hypothetical protein